MSLVNERNEKLTFEISAGVNKKTASNFFFFKNCVLILFCLEQNYVQKKLFKLVFVEIEKKVSEVRKN